MPLPLIEVRQWWWWWVAVGVKSIDLFFIVRSLLENNMFAFQQKVLLVQRKVLLCCGYMLTLASYYLKRHIIQG